MKIRFTSVVILGVLYACTPSVRVPDSELVSPSEAVRRWARVLNTYVDDSGRVDFAGIAADPADLYSYVNYIAHVSPDSQPGQFPDRPTRLAYYINSYNALSMYNVLESDIPDSLAGFEKIRFFLLRRYTIGGKPMSLYTYENKIIRTEGEERVHFALNCMSVSCPRLPRYPFTADQLDGQLNQATVEFFNTPRNLNLDHDRQTVHVSDILRFYEKDFLARSSSLIGYLNMYHFEKVPENYKVAFIKYDWTVNRLDKQTSGVILMACQQEVFRDFAE
jgi:hypothetical protein